MNVPLDQSQEDRYTVISFVWSDYNKKPVETENRLWELGEGRESSWLVQQGFLPGNETCKVTLLQL